MTLHSRLDLLRRYSYLAVCLVFLLVGSVFVNDSPATGGTIPVGTIVVRKVVQSFPNDTTAFTFRANSALGGGQFVLTHNGVKQFVNVPAANGYRVTETVPNGWAQLSATCDNGNNPTSNITVKDGGTVTCTFTNYNTALGLMLILTEGDVTAQPGDLITYTLTYANYGLFDTANVVLTIGVPEYTTYAGSNWLCAPNGSAGSTCTYTVGKVNKNASGQVSFVVRVHPTVPAGITEIRNRAAIGTALVAEVDVDTEQTPLNAAPDLQLTKSDEGQSATPGNTLRYRLNYKNQGNQGATDLVLTETLPEQTTFDAGNSSNGWKCTGATCRLPVTDLAAGAQGATDFAVLVNNPLPTGVTTIRNSAVIADDGSNGDDPTPGNNQATVQTPVNRTVRMVATKSDTLAVDADGDGVPSPGDTLEYVVTIRNQSDVGVANVLFRDTPDPYTTLLPMVESSQGSVTTGNGANNTEVVVALGELAGNGAAATIRFRVQVQNPLPLNVAAVQNQGAVSSSDFGELATDDPDTTASNDATRTPLHAFAQLRATLTDYLFVDHDGNEVVSVGDTLIYRLAIQNSGNGVAGGVQITTTPTQGLALVAGAVATSLGTVGQGNGAGDGALRIDIAEFPVGANVLISYQMRVTEGAQGVVQNQATITVANGLVSGAGALVSDDPDVNGAADVTQTLLGQSAATLQDFYLPLVQRR
ncbi:MAG: DUF11 domain-containing protein [Caldilinea sp. CFX5]|nr:DUF11 domain-containing protein [Caldilinea sp. CFX5]